MQTGYSQILLEELVIYLFRQWLLKVIQNHIWDYRFWGQIAYFEASSVFASCCVATGKLLAALSLSIFILGNGDNDTIRLHRVIKTLQAVKFRSSIATVYMHCLKLLFLIPCLQVTFHCSLSTCLSLGKFSLKLWKPVASKNSYPRRISQTMTGRELVNKYPSPHPAGRHCKACVL